MKILIAGASGKLGSDILRVLCRSEHSINALCRKAASIPADIDRSRFEIIEADVTKPETLIHCCEGVDVVISTVGLTKASAECTNYDVDYQGNMNLLAAAKSAGVKHFVYIYPLSMRIMRTAERLLWWIPSISLRRN